MSCIKKEINKLFCDHTYKYDFKEMSDIYGYKNYIFNFHCTKCGKKEIVLFDDINKMYNKMRIRYGEYINLGIKLEIPQCADLIINYYGLPAAITINEFLKKGIDLKEIR